MTTSTLLVPQPRIWLRALILAAVAAPIWISGVHWFSKVAFCLVMGGFFGTFPRSRISEKVFAKEWFVFFVPAGVARMRLADVLQIETDVETRMGIVGGCFLAVFIGVFNVLIIWLMDWLMPWVGGDYKLWLRTLSDDRVLAWQGNGEANFRENLSILEEVSGRPVTRG